MRNIKIKHSDGSSEPIDENKILSKIAALSIGLDIDPMKVFEKTKVHFYDGIKTSDINRTVAQYAQSLATVHNTDYDTLAARLYMDSLPKMRVTDIEKYGYSENVNDLIVDVMFEIQNNAVLKEKIESIERSYIGIRQNHNSYMQGDENVNIMHIANACEMHYENLKAGIVTLQDVARFAVMVADGTVTFPSPIASRLRFGGRDVSSCCLLKMGDNIDSWTRTNEALVKQSVANNGIGIDISEITSIGEKVKGGKITHAGKIPIIKVIEALINSSKQEGRRGAATAFISMLDPEFEQIMRLKSPKTEVMKRVNDVKYGIGLRMDLLRELTKRNLDLKLFSRRQEQELFDLQYTIDKNFVEKYIDALKSGKLDKYPSIEPTDVLKIFNVERQEVGVYYPLFLDNANLYKTFTEPITQSNLCVSMDTKILTKKHGHIEIGKVLDTEQECWNGEEWSMTKIFKTNDNAKLLEVIITDGEPIKCTPEHRWFIMVDGNAVEVRTSELKPGDVLEGTLNKVLEVKDNGVYAPTACGNEPLKNKLVFNGQLTGNCMEVLTPTKPLTRGTKDKPNIGICVLSNVNQAKCEDDDTLEFATKMLIFGLNSIMREQEHPMPEAMAYIESYASLSIGLSNHAYWLAKNGWRYGDKDALEAFDKWMEKFSYYCIKASMEYARDTGMVPKLFRTKDRRGIDGLEVEITNSSKNMIVKWVELDRNVKEYGLANCAITAIPPSESSSIGSNQVNGINPLKEIVTVKDNGGIRETQFPPEVTKLKNIYDYSNFDPDITQKYLRHVSVAQKWIDMGISAETHTNPELYPDGKIPMSKIVGDIILAWKLGLKGLYYANTPVDTECEGCTVWVKRI